MYLRLPNNTVCPVNEHGYLSTQVRVDLTTILGVGDCTLLDILSVEATGSDLLMDISYSVAGHEGNTLVFDVKGKVSEINCTEVSLDDLPYLDFEVSIVRIGYGHQRMTIRARTDLEARTLADESAGNMYYSESSSDYVIDVCAPQ